MEKNSELSMSHRVFDKVFLKLKIILTNNQVLATLFSQPLWFHSLIILHIWAELEALATLRCTCLHGEGGQKKSACRQPQGHNQDCASSLQNGLSPSSIPSVIQGNDTHLQISLPI